MLLLGKLVPCFVVLSLGTNRHTALSLGSDNNREGQVVKMVKTLYWFRKALRIQDNPSLAKSIQNSSHLVPVFCLDPWFLSSGKVGVNRMGFLLESLADLDNNLRKLGSRLVILKGNPVDTIPRCGFFGIL